MRDTRPVFCVDGMCLLRHFSIANKTSKLKLFFIRPLQVNQRLAFQITIELKKLRSKLNYVNTRCLMNFATLFLFTENALMHINEKSDIELFKNLIDLSLF